MPLLRLLMKRELASSDVEPNYADPSVQGALSSASGRGWLRRLLPTALILLAGLAVTSVLVSIYTQAQQEALRLDTVHRAAAERARLESELSATVYIARGLVAYIRSVDTIKPGQVDEALRAVMNSDHRIRNVGLAPDNVLTYVYPLQGNRGALGFDYRTSATQWPSVQRAIDLKQSVLAGPVDLVQGGRGIISRTPVFLDDGRYWGMISVVIDLDVLLRSVGLDGQHHGIRYFIEGDNAGAKVSDTIFGSPQLVHDSPISMSIAVPGGHWTLLAVPRNGWNVPFRHLLILWTLGTVLSTLLAAFVWLLIARREVARLHALRLTDLVTRLNRANERLAEINRLDELTGIANRRHFDEVLANTWDRCRRHSQPLTVMLIDIDHFKSINDTYGHAAGDACLTTLANRLTGVLQRSDDLIARLGGDEFIALVTGLTAPEALKLGERMRAAAEVDCPTTVTGRSRWIPVTISIGVATLVPSGDVKPGDLLEAADAALYSAKQYGRNRVVPVATEALTAEKPEQAAGAESPVSHVRPVGRKN